MTAPRLSEAQRPLNDTWLNGKPYYCVICGAGFGEFMGCEDVACELESAETAQLRLRDEAGRRALKEPQQ